ncbi:hypothetical protein [Prevotella sp. E2-28]|uniref:hypothetical protein n=1 Tax=Prevotella sp. E2-28 TaxID=2913620 RepID=UPI001EDB5B04|nr:hypothetical protein [Prevotella sp. E2-28]UKK52647.1 hypothetical protein L6465_08515 [Prevotella sp. E2-28]
MREFTIKVKYNIGDKVWIMLDNYPICLKIIRISIQGGEENEDGATSDFGKVWYFLSNDKYKSYTEEVLCDTFEELRDRVFSEAMRENVEKD